MEEHRRRAAIGGRRRFARADHDRLRQDALACPAMTDGPKRPRSENDFATRSQHPLDNVYGCRPAERGVYCADRSGHAALQRWPQVAHEQR